MRRGVWSLRLNGCGTAATLRGSAVDITRVTAASSGGLSVLAADQSEQKQSKEYAA